MQKISKVYKLQQIALFLFFEKVLDGNIF